MTCFVLAFRGCWRGWVRRTTEEASDWSGPNCEGVGLSCAQCTTGRLTCPDKWKIAANASFPARFNQTLMICMYVYIYICYINQLGSPSKMITAIYLVPSKISFLFPLFFLKTTKILLFELPGSLKVREVMSGDPVVWEPWFSLRQGTWQTSNCFSMFVAPTKHDSTQYGSEL